MYKVSEVAISYKPKNAHHPIIADPCEAYALLKDTWGDTLEHHETMKVLLFNNRSHLLGIATIGEGGITETPADIRIIFQYALLSNATCFILAHNHPSGVLKTSFQDDTITRAVKDASKIMNIRFIDHLIITAESYYSYTENGRL